MGGDKERIIVSASILNTDSHASKRSNTTQVNLPTVGGNQCKAAMETPPLLGPKSTLHLCFLSPLGKD
ncbi:hypothetical protein E2C01_064744 [Portunus trituberculatus]|uniref:Uncharacterized protein n=1 Tax=Portunus trituberculatus TaxID=210409 RepID=A0A5B7HPM6_PORTR|nr:hypothetical protein [Portunus trituberculatus]